MGQWNTTDHEHNLSLPLPLDEMVGDDPGRDESLPRSSRSTDDAVVAIQAVLSQLLLVVTKLELLTNSVLFLGSERGFGQEVSMFVLRRT